MRLSQSHAKCVAFGLACLLVAPAARAQTAETVSPDSNHPSGTTNVSGTGFGASAGYPGVTCCCRESANKSIAGRGRLLNVPSF